MVQKQQHLASLFSQNLVKQTNSERLFWIIIDTQLNLREYLKNTVTKIKKQSHLKKFFQKSINPRLLVHRRTKCGSRHCQLTNVYHYGYYFVFSFFSFFLVIIIICFICIPHTLYIWYFFTFFMSLISYEKIRRNWKQEIEN